MEERERSELTIYVLYDHYIQGNGMHWKPGG